MSNFHTDHWDKYCAMTFTAHAMLFGPSVCKGVEVHCRMTAWPAVVIQSCDARLDAVAALSSQLSVAL